MTRIFDVLRTRLALRAAAAILLIVGLLGLIFLILTVNIAQSRQQQTQLVRLEELLSTVENTAQIACFLGDRQLAEEVANGLLSNRIVSAIRFMREDEVMLFLGQPDAGGDGTESITRTIQSPFDPAEQVCRITLTPNQGEISRVVSEASGFLAVALALQLMIIGMSVIGIVLHLVTRPITQISHRLHDLEAETGQKLQTPSGNHRDEIGQLVTSVNAMIDHLVSTLDEERRLRLEREIEERRFRTIFENVETGIFELDGQGRVISANPAFRRLFNLSDDIELSELPVSFTDLLGSGSVTAQIFDDTLSAHTGPLQIELALQDGMLKRWVSVLLNQIEEGRLQGVAHDITERKLATDAAEQLAMTDPLTGLGNRLGFERRLDAMAKLHRYETGYGLALLLLDLDRFKSVNDTLGHAAGDKVLKHVGALLSELVRKSDYVARLGGDEFVVLLDGLDRHELILTIVERFLARVNQPIDVGEALMAHVGASVGIALLGQDTPNTQALVKMADQAMYRAKLSGRNTYCFYVDDH